MLPSTQSLRWPAGRRAPLLGLIALAGAGASACDIPTELPKLETTWVVPGESTTISVNSLLPSGVTLAPSGDAFLLDLGTINFNQSLGQICPECSQFNGLIIPKPEFTANLGNSVGLPASVVSANLTGGQVQTQIQNGFSFDPLRPEGTSARGHIVITATSGTTVLSRDSISGNDTAFPAGSTLTRTLRVNPATVSGPIAVNVRVFSPAGGPIRVNTNERLAVVASPNAIRVGEARVSISNQQVNAAQVPLDTESIDDAVVERLRGGALLLDISNPFAVGGTLVLNITTPSGPIRKQIELKTGESAVRVAFTGAEIRSMLGTSGVFLNATGTVSSPAGSTVVRPNQSVSIRSRLELTVGPNEE